jgi:hypothetical protein
VSIRPLYEAARAASTALDRSGASGDGAPRNRGGSMSLVARRTAPLAALAALLSAACGSGNATTSDCGPTGGATTTATGTGGASSSTTTTGSAGGAGTGSGGATTGTGGATTGTGGATTGAGGATTGSGGMGGAGGVGGAGGLACPGGFGACDGACVDLAFDPGHCGACDVACKVGQACVKGACAVACGEAGTACGDACVDVQSDAKNCGACEVACAAGELCVAGACATPCLGGSTKCGGACVDVANDPKNCGGCAVVCAAGQVCAAGACALECAGGATKCGDACVDTDSDAANCGVCGETCAAGEVCVAGACALECAGGATKCGASCADLAVDPKHCGACDTACPGGQSCVLGVCQGTVCAAGATRVCYDGPAATLGVGACKGGTQACDVLGMSWGACVGEVKPAAAESCATPVDDDCNGQVNEGCYATSCADLHAKQPGVPSGLATIDPDGAGPIAPFQVYCDMVTFGGGYTFIANLTNAGDGVDTGNWLVGGGVPNDWESTTATFGVPDPTLNQDFRSAAFHSVPGQELLVTFKNAPLLRTTAACLGNKSLRDKLAPLAWECAGSQTFSPVPPCAHACDIASVSPSAADTALTNGAARTKLFFKAGEADGAQDTNKDRTYLSTDYRPNVDDPVGLGAFCSGASCTPRPGGADVNDFSDAITPSSPTLFYGLWVR